MSGRKIPFIRRQRKPAFYVVTMLLQGRSSCVATSRKKEKLEISWLIIRSEYMGRLACGHLRGGLLVSGNQATCVLIFDT